MSVHVQGHSSDSLHHFSLKLLCMIAGEGTENFLLWLIFVTSNRYIVHCISKFYELNELMGSYQWELSDKNVHVHADIVNLEGESILQKLFLYLVYIFY